MDKEDGDDFKSRQVEDESVQHNQKTYGSDNYDLLEKPNN